MLQRALEAELPGHACNERAPEARAWRNGHRPARVQTAVGALTVLMSQVRATVEPFVSRAIPDTRRIVRTRQLEALVIGAYVRGLSDREVQSLAEEARLGSLPRSTVSEHDRAREFL